MLDRFHQSDTENAPSVGVYTKSYTNSGAECIGFIRSRVNKTQSDMNLNRYICDPVSCKWGLKLFRYWNPPESSQRKL